MKSDSVPTIQPQRPEALSEACKLADYGERRKEIPATVSQTPGKRSRTSGAVHKLSVSRLLADNKRASVAANAVTSASESMPVDTETSAVVALKFNVIFCTKRLQVKAHN